MFSFKKLFTTSILLSVKGLIGPSCNKCTHFSNNKCFYYKVLLDKYIVSLHDQIMEQNFATEKNALDVHIARSDNRLCGPTGTNYQENKD